MMEFWKCPECGAVFSEDDEATGRYDDGGFFVECPNCGNSEGLTEYYPTDAERKLLYESDDYGFDIDEDDWEDAKRRDD